MELLRDGKLATGSHDRKIMIWNHRSGHLVRTICTGGLVQALTLLSDGGSLASSVDPDRIMIWNVVSGELVKTISMTSGEIPLSMVEFREGYLAVEMFRSSAIRIYNVTTGEFLRSFETHEHVIESMIGFRGVWLATGSGDGRVKVWSPETGGIVARVHGGTTELNGNGSGGGGGGERDDAGSGSECCGGGGGDEEEEEETSVLCMAMLGDGCLVCGFFSGELRIFR